MKLVFMLEERSMKLLLDAILPRILPDDVEFLTIPHDGKSDLEKSLPRKLKAWNEPNTSFVVLHDQDSNDCIRLKKKLTDLCAGYGKRVLIRIPCRELEAWYWGDLAAVSKAYGKDLTQLSRRKSYRVPDAIENPKMELKRYIPDLGQLDGAKRIAPLMDLPNNTSYSFGVFLQGVLTLCREGTEHG